MAIPLLQILIGLVIIMLLYWAITTLMGAFGIGAPISTVVQVIFVVIVVLWLISLLGGGLGIGGTTPFSFGGPRVVR
jgi:hypothetical protein